MVRQFLVDDKGTVLIAAFGVPPFSHRDDPLRGAQAAVDIHNELKSKLNMDNSIGVTTGQAFCGCVGSERRQEYAMVGDIVNLSARLMGVAYKQHDGVLCDENTHKLSTLQTSSLSVEFISKPSVMVKGKSEPVVIFQLKPKSNARKDLTSWELENSTKEVHLVGRMREKRTLHSQLETLTQTKKGGVIVLEGEEGLGKTALVNYIVDVTTNPNYGYTLSFIETLEGAASSFNRDMPFNAWDSILKQLLYYEAEADFPSVTKRKQNLQNQTLSKLKSVASGKKSLFEYTSVLNDIVPELELPETEATARLSRNQRATYTKNIIKILIQQRGPTAVLLIIENLQWLDKLSLELVSEIATEMGDKIMMVLTYRPTLDPIPELTKITPLSYTTVLKLEPLQSGDCLSIVANLLEVSKFSPEVKDVILLANGNPLFAKELSVGLVKSGFLVVKDRVATINEELQSVTVRSEVINGVISSRLDRLDPSLQMLLKVASVIGVQFQKDILISIYPIAEEKSRIPVYLKVLVKESIIAKDEKKVYNFVNPVTQQIAYNRVLYSHRLELHRTIAQYYEARPAEEQYLLIAEHLFKALESAKDPQKDEIEKCIKNLNKGVLNSARSAGKTTPRTQTERLVKMETDMTLWIPKLLSLVANLPETTTSEAEQKKEFQMVLTHLGEMFKSSDNTTRRQTIAFAQ
eukprot:TRINITY_DN7380_c0_g1_i1.p1 TRINITY_DN7380_c0_g1~~TRINITY_DN7380_c0_g1_i1.p1  ORF type:complete len:771 (+),score=163.77 TRINITY_DN7380_c0_g1_i1:243-2315(+)